MRFYTIKEAAAAIADELHGTDYAGGEEGPRAFAERSYVAALQDAVSKNRIVYREPASKLPITQPPGIGAYMTSSWCIVSAADLNVWLDALGVGVRLPTELREDGIQPVESATPGQPADERPTSAELAEVLGPLLQGGYDTDWLKARLNDASRYKKLKRYRAMDGGSPARWEIAGVVMYLLGLGALQWEQAKALEGRYPQLAPVLHGLGQRAEKPATTWHPKGI
ncbi:hypothetical protein [Burkholderia gladioli]|uniref:hypothetical protein n=1 Tax=Burkholderia gladioli TaxID=28095 RepID=UPI001C27E0B7|nr:hypothetical protein [Burkholderia gladioli]MBU9379410.1 hypothetical protein [Burkholderia gladioli]